MKIIKVSIERKANLSVEITDVCAISEDVVHKSIITHLEKTFPVCQYNGDIYLNLDVINTSHITTLYYSPDLEVKLKEIILKEKLNTFLN